MGESEEPRPPDGPGGTTEGPAAGVPSRGTNLAALAGAVILIGLVAFALYRRSHPQTPAGASPPSPTTPAAAGSTIAAVVPFHLSPEATVVAERYRCICSCSLLLNVCTCNNSPGSNEMKRFLQDIVKQGRTPAEIDASMIAKYGPQVLLSNPSGPAPAARPGPTPRKPAKRRKR
ncbi:MAG TPA: hypothetical protein VJ144_01185 [Candidatus Polarisedimenticolia bacterium]|nr:hypothetical protein [Candidatus Polarisedimenticolia bacterium]